MGNRKDIGKAFADKLSSLERTPRENVWNGISYELQKKKKRRIAFFFFWSKTIGLLLVGAIAAVYVYRQNGSVNNGTTINTPETTIVNKVIERQNTTKNNPINNPSTSKAGESTNNGDVEKTNATLPSKKVVTTANNSSYKNILRTKNSRPDRSTSPKESLSKGNYYGKKGHRIETYSKVNSKKRTKKSKLRARKTKNRLENPSILATQDKVNPIDLTALQSAPTTVPAKEMYIKKKDTLTSKKGKEKPINITMLPEDKTAQDSAKSYRKFDLDAFASPTYYGYLAKGSTLDNSLGALSKKATIQFSYGAGLTYDVTEKISVRIGYSHLSLSVTTQNAPINTTNYTGIAYNPNISNQTIAGASNGAQKMDITQKISYTEIPLEVKYKFLDKKIGLKASFGFSYLLLNDNTVSIKTDTGYQQEIGKTKDLSPTSVSLNAGLEADYPLFKNVKLFIEPLINYHVKSSNSSNFKPYIFGIHTGIRYTFLNK